MDGDGHLYGLVSKIVKCRRHAGSSCTSRHASPRHPGVEYNYSYILSALFIITVTVTIQTWKVVKLQLQNLYSRISRFLHFEIESSSTHHSVWPAVGGMRHMTYDMCRRM